MTQNSKTVKTVATMFSAAWNDESSSEEEAAQVTIHGTKTFTTKIGDDIHNFSLRCGKDANDDMWFVLKDVCELLGIKNHRNWAVKLRKDGFEDGVQRVDILDSNGRKQKTTVVKEDIVYHTLCARSRKKIAKQFRRWSGEVLRTIRKTGQYVAPAVNTRALELQERQIALDEKKLEMQIIEMSQRMFPGDVRMAFYQKERTVQLLGSGQRAITQGQPRTITEILQKNKQKRKFILDNRQRIGSYIAKRYRRTYGEPGTTGKIHNGHLAQVKCYPYDKLGVIDRWIEEYY